MGMLEGEVIGVGEEKAKARFRGDGSKKGSKRRVETSRNREVRGGGTNGDDNRRMGDCVGKRERK